MALGARIKAARLELGLTQKQLCGEKITRNMLSLLENESASPSVETLMYLAQRLGKPVGYFLEEDAVTSPNQAVMAQARQASPREALEILKAYRTPDSIFDSEYYLLLTLHSMTLARQALEEGKTGYCRELLAQAENAAKNTPYDTAELQKSRLLLAWRLEPQRASELAQQLHDEETLCLQAQAALQNGEASQCLAWLRTAKSETAVFLRAEAFFSEKDYVSARKEYEKLPGNDRVYARLEQCCRELEDYKQAYHYACLQRN